MKKYLLILFISINTYALQILDKNVADQNTDSVKISLQNIIRVALTGKAVVPSIKEVHLIETIDLLSYTKA